MEQKFTELKEVVLSATPGSPIGECMREALLMAATEWRNVKLIHNGKNYYAKPNRMLETIISDD